MFLLHKTKKTYNSRGHSPSFKILDSVKRNCSLTNSILNLFDVLSFNVNYCIVINAKTRNKRISLKKTDIPLEFYV